MIHFSLSKSISAWMLATLTAGLLFFDSAPAFGQFQRMRIPTGAHRLRPNENNIAKLRANCVDRRRGAPDYDDLLRPASSSPISIARWPKGRPREIVEQSLSEAIGNWIEVRGNSSGASLNIEILEPAFEYEVRVGRDIPGILGPPSAGRPALSSDAESLVTGLARKPAVAAMRKLDDFHEALGDVFGKESPEAIKFRARVDHGRDLWGNTIFHALQEHNDPNGLASDLLQVARAELFGRAAVDVASLAPENIYRLATFRTGKPLTANQLRAVQTLFDLQRAPQPQEGIERELEQFRTDAALVRNAFGADVEAKFRDELSAAIGRSETYQAAKEMAQQEFLSALGVQPEQISARSIQTAYALHTGKLPQQNEAETLAELFDVRPELDLPVGLDQAPKDIARVGELFDEQVANSVRVAFVEGFLSGSSAEAARRRAARTLVDDYSFGVLRGTRNRLKLIELLYPNSFSPEQSRLLEEWLSLPGPAPDYSALARLTIDIDISGRQILRLRGTELEETLSIEEASADALRGAAGDRIIVASELLLEWLTRQVPAGRRQALKRVIIPLGKYLRRERQSAFISETDGDINVRRHCNADPADQMQVETIRLKGKNNQGFGDGILVHFPNDRVLLIDTANDREGLARIEERLAAHQSARRAAGKPLRIDVLVTHEDKDHIAGLKTLLARFEQGDAEGLEIGNVIYGFHQPKSALASGILGRLRRLFDVEDVTPHLIVGRRRKSGGSAGGLRITSHVLEEVSVLNVSGVGSAKVTVFQVNRPTSSNNSSLVVRLTHNGVTQLMTGDIEIDAMRALLKSPAVDLRADILKWPHHRSFRSSWTKGDRQVLRDFLLAVSPHTIVISNAGPNQTETMVNDITEFAKKILDDRASGTQIRVESTDDGTSRTTTLNMKVPQRATQTIKAA